MNEVWAHIKTFLLNKGLDIAGAAVVLVVGLWAIKLLTRLVSKSKGFRKADPGAAGFLLSFGTVALKLVLFLTVISMLGIPVVNFVTILATAGAAVGLAMQGSLSNLVGGVMLLFFKPFKVGDYIDTHTDAGTVDKISIFYTTLGSRRTTAKSSSPTARFPTRRSSIIRRRAFGGWIWSSRSRMPATPSR